MPAKFDIQEFIKSLKLGSEEDKKVIEKIFATEENVAEIQRGWNSRSESSRLVDEAKAEKAEADRIKAEVASQREKNVAWADALKKYETETQQQIAERNDLLAEKTAYESYLKSIGVEPEFALEGKKPIDPTVPRQQEPPVPDPAKAAIDPKVFESYLKRDEVVGAVNILSNLPFELTNLNFKHMELYGKPVATSDLAEIQKAYLNPQNQRSLSDIAAESLHFAEREKAMAEEALNKRAEQMAQEMYTKRMSELNLPGAAVDQIQPNLESVVKFASKGFSENAGRASEAQSGTVSQEEMQQFLEIDHQLAAQGIRPTPW